MTVIRTNRGSFKLGHTHSKEVITKIKKKLKGREAWNKGLTKELDERIRKKAEIASEKKNEYWEEHSEMKEQISKTQIERYKKDPEIMIRHSKIMKIISNHPEKIQQFKERMKNIVIPKKDSKIEVKIQRFLKQIGIDFFIHQYMKEIEHSYQCDILIPSKNLVIECDGNYWHKYPVGRDIDKVRTKELIEKGFRVLRLWESEIKKMSLNNFKNIVKKQVYY